MNRKTLFIVTTILLGQIATHAAATETRLIEEVVVIGSKDKVYEIPGSGALLDESDLDKFDHVDLGKMLESVPGVYIREEDGYGLRPNIGIRGATTDRSQKITIMEDGVLITPAPYSAPAAYYVPNISRMAAIEVLKGPSAIQHGPHTVGGAINFVTKRTPDKTLGELDLSFGTDGFYKWQASFGTKVGNFGILLDGLYYGSDGFKDLDTGGDTGFERKDFTVKLHWQPPTERMQALTLKFGYGDEDADETYLGLTDSDFYTNPKRRYAASQLDRFQSEHWKIHANYGAEINERTRINAKAYYNEFDRSWNKLGGFVNGPDLKSVLANPGQYTTQYAIITGASNSLNSDDQILDVTDKDRSIESKGIQASLTHLSNIGNIELETQLGVRFHSDEVSKNRQPRSYLMSDNKMISDGIDRSYKVLNHAKTDAIAIYLAERISWEKLSIDLGVRYESINGDLLNRGTGDLIESSTDFVSPGIGIIWEATDNLSLLVGLHKGFSPPGPGSSVDPEESLNYEYGLRYRTNFTTLEAVGFFSDYDNLLGRCRVSDTGCNAGEEFNGGAVEISGVEITSSLEIPIADDISLNSTLSYTYTKATFETTFLSNFSQWGIVQAGDSLPYLPTHLGQALFGVTGNRWDVNATLKFQEQMREVPGSGALDQALHADGYISMDLSAGWQATKDLKLQLTVQNVTNESAIISHRPFGARPNMPRSFIVRLKYTID